MRSGLVVFAGLALAAPGVAHAGRSFFGWLNPTEVMPERGAELQSWVAEENKDGSRETSWVVGPYVGVTDQLELGLPLELVWSRAGATSKFTWKDFAIEARYRLVTQDPVDAPPFAPLLRVAVKRLVTDRNAVRPEADLVGSFETGSVQILADVGFIAELELSGAKKTHFEARPGAGVSVKAIGDLRVGAEVYSELSLDDNGESWVVAGPNMSWTHGRFWLTAAYGIGLYQINDAPRILWGIAF